MILNWDGKPFGGSLGKVLAGVFKRNSSDRSGDDSEVLPSAKELFETFDRIRSFGAPVVQSVCDFEGRVHDSEESPKHEVLDMVYDPKTKVYVWPHEVGSYDEQ